MNAIYTNMEEVADLYINSGEKKSADLHALVREVGQTFMAKYGKECAKEVVAKYRDTIRTKAGLAGFLTDMKVEDVRFNDIFTGELDSLFVSIR